MAERVEELAGGVVVYQVTDEPALKDNIYCERSYCSPDSEFFVFQRYIDTMEPSGLREAEYIACDFDTWTTRVLGRGRSYPEVSRQGTLYHMRSAAGDTRELVRIDMATGQSEVLPTDDGVGPRTGLTISPDETRVAYGVTLAFEPQMFGVEVLDIETGDQRLVCRDRDICNPHVQFDQDDGSQLMVQHNRGCLWRPDGTMERLLGEEGCTLFLVAVEDGAITRLPVGPPHMPTCTGHEQWMGADREILFTCAPQPRGSGPPSTLRKVRADGPAEVVSPNGVYNHVNASVCGRYFCCDSMSTGEVVVGSVRTGASAVVGHFAALTPELRDRYGQSCHAHPRLSPDLRWVVYNACPAGRPEIHVASIPPEAIAQLDGDDTSGERPV